jgi:hypothetical protein
VIGVIGHRILADPDRISAAIVDALDKIMKAFPEGSLRIISSLAEGADRLVAYQILKYPDARLTAVLPLLRSDYMNDFHSTESRSEFLNLLDRADTVIELPSSGSREKAYETAGWYVLDHCQVLIAVWDGCDSQGQGGTGDLVSEARRRSLPIAWVHAGNRKLGTNQPTTLGADQGKVSFERFSDLPAPERAREAHG